MKVFDPRGVPWMGSETSYNEAISLQARMDSMSVAEMRAAQDEARGFEVPSLLSREGSVGIISISGTLYSSAPDWAKALFNVIDYNDVKNAAVEAASDADIKSIVLKIESGGGAATGLRGAAEFLSALGSQKPMIAYTEQAMFSAALWLGTTAQRLSSDVDAQLGSLGVITTHREYTKLNEQDGITAKVLRSGRYKALGNPEEEFTAEAERSIQTKLDYLYNGFLEHVAGRRNHAPAMADAAYGQGREFFGPEAVSIGLSDAVETYDEALTFAANLAAKALDSRKSLNQNPKQQQKEGSSTMGTKTTMSAAQVAALAAGAPTGEHEKTKLPEGAGNVTDEAAAAAAAEAEAAAAAAAQASASKGNSEVVALLTSRLADKDAAVLKSALQIAGLEAQVASLKSELEILPALQSIAQASARNMAIALSAGHAHIEGLSASALLTEHARIKTAFESQFIAGGVAAASAGPQDDDTGATEAAEIQRNRRYAAPKNKNK